MKSIGEILKQTGLQDGTERASDLPREPLPDLPAENPACSRCDGAGFVRKAVQLGHPDFGRAFPCDCTRDEQEDVKRARLLRYSNLGPLARLTFENLSPRGRSPNAQHQDAFAAATRAGEAFAAQPAGWLVLVGPSGCGKTHLSAAIAGKCIANGQGALFMVVPDLLDHLRAAYQPGSEAGYDEVFETVRNAPVLILDDLGVQNTTPWVEEKLFQLINHRYSSQLATVITTNLDLSSFDQRLQTRLGDPALSKVHHLEGGAGGDLHTLDSLDLPLLKRMTFKTFDPKLPAANQAEVNDLEALRREAMRFASTPEGWFVIAGQSGKGKTRIAAAIGNFWRESGRPVMFVVVPDLLDRLRSAYNPQNPNSFDDMFDRVRNVPLLILDDLGAQSGTPWADEKLFQLVNHRYNACLPTVITTNSRRSELDTRLFTRLLDPQVSTIQQVGDFNILGEGSPSLRLASDKPTRGRPRSR
jgi:DNA replication protein DnaC